MNNRALTYIGVLALLFFMGACKQERTSAPLPEPVYFNPERPAHFPAAHYEFGDNVFTKEGFELGKKLFHDPLLSITGTISCASCHKQQDAFADAGIRFSKGVNGGMASRNAPPIVNLAWNTSFMWDGGVNHLEVSPLGAIQHPLEMAETPAGILRKLQENSVYRDLFKNAFHKDSIDVQQIFWAFAQYMGNIVSANSKYDKYITGTGGFSDAEMKGLVIFRRDCSTCHSEPLTTNYSFQNNGLDNVFVDSGRFRITRNVDDIGKFKVPTLRNIELTHPYMHDGRFVTLLDVVNHYSEGVMQSPTLSTQIEKEGLKLTEEEKANLIAFLKTLTDIELVNNPLYQ
ncbi:MAG: c-type cytochrome [Chitinophagaceae bacterium]|nr:c-type cytochrome [Chitinophagaceae bacterium]